MRTAATVLAGLCLLCRVSLGLGPHEVIVLANERSPDSIDLAKTYMRLRSIPESNLVRLSLPDKAFTTPGASVSSEEFTQLIWSPAQAQVQSRGLADHILAWVYSVGFPTTIKGSPPISIQGLTFLRNRFPSGDDVGKGLYESPLFAGPEEPGARSYFPQSFDKYKQWLGDGEMPLPSMMLGLTGPRGNTVEEITACLQRGVSADGTRPFARVLLVAGEDVRSTCRQWQFPGVREELAALRVEALITRELPAEPGPLIGLMMGAREVKPPPGVMFLPGAMAEHLTSFGAMLSTPHQTKLSVWIRAGATASAGTVSEPLSNWHKFPHARFYVHYASGCTLMESFYQSVRSPLQILFVGEPLACPWQPAGEVAIEGLGEGPLSGTIKPRVTITAPRGTSFRKVSIWMDGKPVATGRTPVLDTTAFENGHHSLRAVAHQGGLVRSQIFTVRRIEISNDRP